MNLSANKCKLPELHIGNKTARLPIIQGGMGVGVSLSGLAGAVAKEGGVGIISTAQIGYDDDAFEYDQAYGLKKILEPVGLIAAVIPTTNPTSTAIYKSLISLKTRNAIIISPHPRAKKSTIEAAKVVLEAAVAAGADVIISGAGLPIDLPALVDKACQTKIAPIVSSKRAAQLILKMWSHKYDRTADFIVIEGPKAGGHLGFSNEQLNDTASLDFDNEITNIIECKKEYEDKYSKKIPVIVAGGIFDKQDIIHAIKLGADGVQIASRFVATKECDASPAYKQAYINARQEDVQIIQSPVGMPGRALRNAFIEQLDNSRIPISKCYNCLEKCNPAKVPYCITKALINAVKGDVDNGLIFCGDNVGRINEITTVHSLMKELTE